MVGGVFVLCGFWIIQNVPYPTLKSPPYRLPARLAFARMGYWRGRANEVLGNKKDAKTDYRLAAQYQTTFYGQPGGGKIK